MRSSRAGKAATQQDSIPAFQPVLQKGSWLWGAWLEVKAIVPERHCICKCVCMTWRRSGKVYGHGTQAGCALELSMDTQ